MEEISNRTEIRDIKPENNTAKRIVGAVFGVIEVILFLRFIFKLLGANADNGFIHGIYVGTQFFVGIFVGIFPQATTGGAAAVAVFEPATLIAIGVIAIIAWVVLKLMKPRIGTHEEETTKTGFAALDNNDERNE